MANIADLIGVVLAFRVSEGIVILGVESGMFLGCVGFGRLLAEFRKNYPRFEVRPVDILAENGAGALRARERPQRRRRHRPGHPGSADVDVAAVALVVGQAERARGKFSNRHHVFERLPLAHRQSVASENALDRLADKSCKECVTKLEEQIERDKRKTVKAMGGDLVNEMRCTLARIQQKG